METDEIEDTSHFSPVELVLKSKQISMTDVTVLTGIIILHVII